jgi:hypothetical protein
MVALRRPATLRASYLCAAVGLGLLAIHFNAGLLPGWTRALSVVSGGFALAGAAFAALHLARHGWTRLGQWPAQAALALNAFLGLAFLFYA